MRCKVKISYSDKGKIIAKLYSNGAMVIGLKKIGKDLYYFAEDGHMCHTNPSGALV